MDHRRAFELGKQSGVWSTATYALILLSLVDLKPLPWYTRVAMFAMAMFALHRWSKTDDQFSDEIYKPHE